MPNFVPLASEEPHQVAQDAVHKWFEAIGLGPETYPWRLLLL